LALASSFVERSASAAATFANVQRNFISIGHWLEITFGIVKALSGEALTTFVGHVVAPHNPNLRRARRSRAA
jgi:hypothetical protein